MHSSRILERYGKKMQNISMVAGNEIDSPRGHIRAHHLNIVSAISRYMVLSIFEFCYKFNLL